MNLIITILPVVTKDLPISHRFTPYDFLSRCKFSTLRAVLMGTKSCTKILILPKISPTRFRFTFYG